MNPTPPSVVVMSWSVLVTMVVVIGGLILYIEWPSLTAKWKESYIKLQALVEFFKFPLVHLSLGSIFLIPLSVVALFALFGGI